MDIEQYTTECLRAQNEKEEESLGAKARAENARGPVSKIWNVRPTHMCYFKSNV